MIAQHYTDWYIINITSNKDWIVEMEYGYVTSKGQIVIPARLRKKYNIKEGTMVYFREKEDVIELEPITSETIRRNIGVLGTKGKLLKALMQEKKKERKL